MGVWISQACSTFTTLVYQAAMAVELGSAQWVMNVGADRMSNGPHTYGLTLADQVATRTEKLGDGSFNFDPWAKEPMVDTADKIANEEGITKQECDELAWIATNSTPEVPR